ncbi:hypothetical protein A8W25_01360 [Streptomyces sp. ERV7]|uniref:hypothetical protein n=1 Tax=Streptomyces sp. ERV7 TaxID=1322334 RepID=UPI0007F51491|nr:hypothetical protein [Streptomyces sp. ERV7]OAR26964.1 hypothetical protein A8W25_01360 [Streptomyces sp. ERV7]
MSGQTPTLERFSPLWEAPAAPPRWVIWHAGEGESLVFDRKFNVPFDVDDVLLGEVLRRMREAGAPEGDAYPGRPCG